jgi:hypothetical protein
MKESDTMTDQQIQLARVERNIGDLVRTFVVERFLTNPQFHIVELIKYVTESARSAPTSPDRMLRKLRKDGFCDYRVVDRAKSIYEITTVHG